MYTSLSEKPTTLVIPSNCTNFNVGSQFNGLKANTNLIFLDGVTSILFNTFPSPAPSLLCIPESVNSLRLYDNMSPKFNVPNNSAFTLTLYLSGAGTKSPLYIPKNVTSLNDFNSEVSMPYLIIESTYFNFPSLSQAHCRLIDASNVDWSDGRTTVKSSGLLTGDKLIMKIGVGEIEDAKTKLLQNVSSGTILTDGVTTYTWNGSAWA